MATNRNKLRRRLNCVAPKNPWFTTTQTNQATNRKGLNERVQEVSYAHYADTSNTTCSVGMMRFQHEQFRVQAPEVRDDVGYLRSQRGQRHRGCHNDIGGNNDRSVGAFLHIATKGFD